MSTYNDHNGRKSKGGPSYTGWTGQKSYFSKKKTCCEMEGCDNPTTIDSTYCEYHYKECPDCGKRICKKSARCSSCAAVVGNQKRLENGYNQTRYCKKQKAVGHRAELLDLIECYENGWFNNFYPEMCRRHADRLKLQLEEYDSGTQGIA